jgi:hypothetical protein
MPAPPIITPKRVHHLLCASGGRGCERRLDRIGDIDSGRRTTEYGRHGGRREHGRHIGIVESASVKKFDLYKIGELTEMVGGEQTLTGASIVKSETKITMKFDKLLVEGDEASLADPANYFLHARYEGDSIGYIISRNAGHLRSTPLLLLLLRRQRRRRRR